MPTKEMVRLDLPHILTTLPGPRATALIERDSQVLSPSYTRCYPLVAARGEGAMIEDVDGNRFLDFNAGIAVVSTGHCHPKVVDSDPRAIQPADSHVGHRFLLREHGATGGKAGGRSRQAAASIVCTLETRGAEATEAAMKLARYHTGRDKFIAFTGSFHGRTMGALSLTGSKVGQRKRLWAAGSGRVSCPVSRSLSPPARYDRGGSWRELRSLH